jgi:hypothetical protein
MLIPLGFLASSGGESLTDYELIESVILGSAQSSVTFSSLGTYSSAYKHLQLRFVAKSTQAGTGSGGVLASMELNATAFTKNHYLYAEGTYVESGVGANGFIVPLVRAGATNVFSSGVVDLLDVFSSTKNKTIRTLAGYTNEMALSSNLWASTNTITSATIKTSADNFAIGSRFSLYGIKG